MIKFALRFLPVLVLCVSVMAGCAPKKVTTDEVAETTEVVPEDTMAAEAAPAPEAAEGMKESPIETTAVVDKDLEALAEEVRKLYTVHFDFDKYNIRPEDATRLRQNASWLKKHKGVSITIEGHADERGETEYNLALGDKRAESVKDFLASLGVERSRLSTISYGEEKPVDTGHNESAWSKNRRAEFRLAK